MRPLSPEDEPILWQMLYQAIYVPEGQPKPPFEVVYQPELAHYVQNWGRGGDRGYLATAAVTRQPIGAAWLRLLNGENKGYGYVDDDTPELSIAVLPEYRCQGIGTQLLRCLFSSDGEQSSVSLSVSVNNPAVRLYERFGFEIVDRSNDSLTMKRG